MLQWLLTFFKFEIIIYVYIHTIAKFVVHKYICINENVVDRFSMICYEQDEGVYGDFGIA